MSNLLYNNQTDVMEAVNPNKNHVATHPVFIVFLMAC